MTKKPSKKTDVKAAFKEKLDLPLNALRTVAIGAHQVDHAVFLHQRRLAEGAGGRRFDRRDRVGSPGRRPAGPAEGDVEVVVGGLVRHRSRA